MAAEDGREAAGRETAGDRDANVEDGREEVNKDTGGTEDSHGGTAAAGGTGGAIRG